MTLGEIGTLCLEMSICGNKHKNILQKLQEVKKWKVCLLIVNKPIQVFLQYEPIWCG